MINPLKSIMFLRNIFLFEYHLPISFLLDREIGKDQVEILKIKNVT